MFCKHFVLLQVDLMFQLRAWELFRNTCIENSHYEAIYDFTALINENEGAKYLYLLHLNKWRLNMQDTLYVCLPKLCANCIAPLEVACVYWKCCACGLLWIRQSRQPPLAKRICPRRCRALFILLFVRHPIIILLSLSCVS